MTGHENGDADGHGRQRPQGVGLLTVPEAAAWLQAGRGFVYDLVRRGDLPAVRIGRNIRISYGALQAWVERHEGAGPE